MSSGHTTRIESWKEWKRECAIQLCSEATKDDLSSFAAPVIGGLYHKFDRDLQVPVSSDRWHLFETYMHATSSKTGKRWKDWLFEKADGSNDDPAIVLEKEANCCMGSVILKICQKEGRAKDIKAGRTVVSTDEPVSGGADSPTIGSTLAAPKWMDPASQAEWKELQEIAIFVAEFHIAGMERPQKVALIANTLGISLDDPTVKATAQRGKDALYRYVNQIPDDIRATIESKYESEDSETIDALFALTVNALRECILIWGKSERSIEPFFRLADDERNP